MGYRIDINIVVDDTDAVFSALIDAIDESDRFDYYRMSDKIIGLTGELSGSSLRTKRQDRHVYDYGESIIKYIIRGDRLDRADGGELFDAALSFVPYLYSQTDPQYIFGMHDSRIERIGANHLDQGIPSPVSDAGLANNRIDHPTWLMLFPPEMVEEYGREWLLDLPVETVTELDDGAIMTVATERIPECESDVGVAEEILDAMEPIEKAFRERDL